MRNIKKFNEFYHVDNTEESPKGDVRCKTFETFEELESYVKANPNIFNNINWSLLHNGSVFDRYQKRGCKFSVVSDCSVAPYKVLGVISCDGVVKNCFDQDNRPCKPGELQEMLSQLGMTEKDL